MSRTLSWIYGLLFLAFAGLRVFAHSDLLFGLFSVDHAHNLMHVVSGIAGLLAGIAGVYWSRLYLWTAGLVYLAVCVAGFIAGQVLGVALSTADNFLHLAIATVALYTVFAEDPRLGSERVPITGLRGVTDFREPAHR